MEAQNITTVFDTNTHQVIGSRYERSMYETSEQMLADFKNDLELQSKTYGGAVDMFAVIVRDKDNVKSKAFVGEIDKEKILGYVENLLK